MCGMLVSDVSRVQERYCLCCARKLPIIGDTCPECEAAIHLGAVALVEARLRNRNTEKQVLPAVCPASAPLEALYQKFRRRHEKSLQYQAAYRERNRERLRAYGREYYWQHVEERKAKWSERRKNDAYRQQERERHQTEERRAWERANFKKRYYEDEEFRARRAEHNRRYRERKRAAFLALSPEEQKAQLVARRETDAYKRKQQTNKAAYDRMMADPERAAKHRARRNEYEAREDVKQRKKQRYARSVALKKLIKDNELLDREREAAQYERQWEALGAEDRGNQGAVRGDSLRGNNAGESQLGVVVHRGLHAPKGPQVAQNGPVGV